MKVYVITDSHGYFEGNVFENEQDADTYCKEYNKKVKFPTLGGSIGYDPVVTK